MHESLINPSEIERVLSTIAALLRDVDRPVLVALDGRSGAGKSSIAATIAQRLEGVAITADDFWVGGSNDEWDTRSPREKSNLAIDWRRLRAEVLEPLFAGQVAAWHPFDWKSGHGLSPDVIHSEPRRLIVLDGAYSTRPELQDIIDLSILVEVPDDTDRRERLLSREGEEYMRDWHVRWGVAEDYYFSHVTPRSSFNVILSNK